LLERSEGSPRPVSTRRVGQFVPRLSRISATSYGDGTIRPMGRWAHKLSDEQKAAVVRAMLEDAMGAEEVVELAAGGELYGLEPFDISPSTVRELRAEAERERPTNGGPKTEHDRARAIAEATLARVEAMDSPTAKDLHAARQAAQIIRDADKQVARERPKRLAERKTGCRHIKWGDERDDREPCTCSKPCFGAWLCADFAKVRQIEAEGRREPCKGFATSGDDVCYHCGEPLADHERLHYDGQEWSELHQRAYPQLAQV
jgi:hypothetical protein